MAKTGKAHWRDRSHSVELEWVSAMDFAQVMSKSYGVERELLLNQGGVYLWRVDAWIVSRRNLYVGQTNDGFAKRTSGHLRSHVGTKLKSLVDDGKSPYVLYGVPRSDSFRPGIEPEGFWDMLYDAVERALIWTLKPEWNSAHTVTMEMPISIEISHIGEVPKGLESITLRKDTYHKKT